MKTENIRGYTIYTMQSSDNRLYIVQSGAGEIRAGAAVQMLISTYSVDIIVNYGVVGALTDDLKVANTCIVEKAVHYDMDTSATDYCEVGRYLEYEDIYLPTTFEYVQKVITYDTSIIPVICASGDKFISDESEKRRLHKAFNADICDMESAAIILICDLNNVPNLIIKTISDSITGGAEEFHSRVDESAEICLVVIDRLLKEL